MSGYKSWIFYKNDKETVVYSICAMITSAVLLWNILQPELIVFIPTS